MHRGARSSAPGRRAHLGNGSHCLRTSVGRPPSPPPLGPPPPPILRKLAAPPPLKPKPPPWKPGAEALGAPPPPPIDLWLVPPVEKVFVCLPWDSSGIMRYCCASLNARRFS